MVVVAENRSLSLGLTGLDFDVVDLRPAEFRDWLEDGAESPALVIVGVEQPGDAVEIVAATTQRHPETPALVVTGPAEAWHDLSLSAPNVTVLALPVTRLSLVAAAQRLIAATTPAPAPEEPASAPSALDGETELEPSLPAEPLVDMTPVAEVTVELPALPTPTEPVRHMVAARSTDALRERLSHRPATTDSTLADHHEPFDAAALREAVAPAGADATATTVTPTPVPQQPLGASRTQVAAAGEIRQLVRSLLSCADQLCDVRDAAAAVVDESLAVSEATTGVLMLPDGDVWRVCGAVGVRPIEWRYIVEPDSWLATTVIDGARGVIVQDSDIARQRLGGAPLVHHTQLLAVPVPGARGLVMVARDTTPFTEDQLDAVARVAEDAGPLLSDALAVRFLARALSDFRALDD